MPLAPARLPTKRLRSVLAGPTADWPYIRVSVGGDSQCALTQKLHTQTQANGNTRVDIQATPQRKGTSEYFFAIVCTHCLSISPALDLITTPFFVRVKKA